MDTFRNYPTIILKRVFYGHFYFRSFRVDRRFVHILSTTAIHS